MLTEIQKQLLAEIADLHKVPEGAYNIRANGEAAGRNSTANIEISSKTDKPGIDIRIKPCDVVIVAGCGISNCGDQDSAHDGVHCFYIGKNCKLKYVEKHYGEGTGRGKRIMNPRTEVHVGEGSSVEMEMVQIKGVDDTKRETFVSLEAGARLVVHERLMTHDEQRAESGYTVELNGPDSSADVVSRSVARDRSWQLYRSRIVGNALCSGHTECDAIIMDEAKVLAVPELEANCIDAALIHEAAIGKIAGDQIVKLMTLGLTEAEAEEQIINGFLR